MTLTIEGSADLTDPTSKEVEYAVCSLDGKQVTEMSLVNDETEDYLGIGGGNGGQYMIFVSRGNTRCYTLTNRSRGDGEVILKVGGQKVNYKAYECHPLEVAMTAAQTFLSTEEMDPRFAWEEL